MLPRRVYGGRRESFLIISCDGRILAGSSMQEGSMHIGRVSLLCALIVAVAGAAAAEERNAYRSTILVSNEADEAPLVDPKLVNGWGIAASATSPWWVSNNVTNSSTLYRGDGSKVNNLEPNVSGGPTGIVNYGGMGFEIEDGFPSVFIFAATDGTFS